MNLDFIVAGFSKCGTTTLCSLLASHPAIFIPPKVKEPRLFNRENYERYWMWYVNLFRGAPARTLLGEGSVAYSDYEFEVISRERILKHYPNIKLIFIARDPIDRIESSYREMHHSGPDWGKNCPFSIEEALIKRPNMLKDTQYLQRLNNYQQFMPDSNILVLFLEDLQQDPHSAVTRCFAFLGVDPKVKIENISRRLNRGSEKYYDSKKLRLMRIRIYHPETAFPLGGLPRRIQDQFLPQLGLRIPFKNEPLEWSPAAKKSLVETVGDDVGQFLEQQGKTVSFWPRFAEIYEHG